MHKVHMHAGAIRQLLYGCAYVLEIIHSLKLVDYPLVHTHKPNNNSHSKGYIVCHCSFCGNARDLYCTDYSLFVILKSKNKSVSKNRITGKSSTVRHFLVISTCHQYLGHFNNNEVNTIKENLSKMH